MSTRWASSCTNCFAAAAAGGCHPFDVAGHGTVRRHCDGSPRRYPSAHTGATASRPGCARAYEHARRLRDGLRGDLDTIVLDRLAGGSRNAAIRPWRRSARTSSATCNCNRSARNPIRLRYRARMFLRRNALAVAATVAVTLALIGGLVASFWQAHIAEHERERAEQESKSSEQRFEDVRGLAHAMIFDLHDES